MKLFCYQIHFMSLSAELCIYFKTDEQESSCNFICALSYDEFYNQESLVSLVIAHDLKVVNLCMLLLVHINEHLFRRLVFHVGIE